MKPKHLLSPVGYLFVITLGSALAAETAGPFAHDSWKISSGEFKTANDPGWGRAVLTVTNGVLVLDSEKNDVVSQELRARVRLRTDLSPTVNAYFSWGMTNAADPGFSMNLAASRGQNAVSAVISDRGRPSHDNEALTAKSDWSVTRSSAFTYVLRAYPQAFPGWEANYRAQIEESMSHLPDLESKWVDVRIQFRKGLVRMWMEDHLVAEKEDALVNPQGALKIQLSPGVQLASCEIRPLEETDGFLPIGLGGYANARTFLGKDSVDPKSFPSVGKITMLDGIPFEFPGVNSEGNDHIDVGQSLFRDANTLGYAPAGPIGVPNARWQGSTYRDPARIQMRIPAGYYDNLYLVAASDGEENSVPLLSAMFYRPGAGFTETFEGRVPLATVKAADVKPFPVTLSNGKKTNLWLVRIPLDPAKLTSFSDMDVFEVELTKKTYLYRSYPDPICYGYQAGGLPSGVHIYAATLSKPSIVFQWKPDRFGHAWTFPEVAAYTATVTNTSKTEISGKLTVTTRSYDGTEETKQEKEIKVAAGGSAEAKFSFPVKLNGYHDITATLDVSGKSWTEKRAFARLATDTRSTKWTEGKGALFGCWAYAGVHHTPKLEYPLTLMTLAGARVMNWLFPGAEKIDLVRKHWSPGSQGNASFVQIPPWAADENKDPSKVEEYKKNIVKAVEENENSRHIPPEFTPPDVYIFAEPHISTRLTSGNYPEYWGDEPFVYTEEEKQSLKRCFETARIAAEAYRVAFPTRKILLPYGDPLYIVPFLRAGFPTNLVDGGLIDTPLFEKMPERQLHEQSIHRLYELRKEYEKVGIKNPYLIFGEGPFFTTEPGSCTWREQIFREETISR